MKRKIKELNGKVSLKEAIDEFLQEKELNNMSEATIQAYFYTFKQFQDYFDFAEDMTPDEITQSNLYQWINHMKKNNLAIPSINHHIRGIKTFILWCQRKEYIQTELELKELKCQEVPPKFFADEDLEKLLEKPRAKDSFVEWRTWTMVNFCLATGARMGTLIEMRVSDIDFSRKEISFAHTKNKKALIVPLSASLENALKEYLRKFDLSGYLFPNIGDDKISTDGLKYAFKRYANSRGVNQTNIHGLRHSFARSWVKNGGSAFALQKILGHSTLGMTQRYIRLYAEDIKEDYEDFSALDVMKKKSRRTSVFKKQVPFGLPPGYYGLIF